MLKNPSNWSLFKDRFEFRSTRLLSTPKSVQGRRRENETVLDFAATDCGWTLPPFTHVVERSTRNSSNAKQNRPLNQKKKKKKTEGETNMSKYLFLPSLNDCALWSWSIRSDAAGSADSLTTSAISRKNEEKKTHLVVSEACAFFFIFFF